MNCENPLFAVRLLSPSSSPTGKSVLKIVSMTQYNNQNDLELRFGKDNVLRLPCGKCASCREAYKQDWSVRCDMEARYHEKNVFITLTYRPECCPRWVSKQHLRRFIKKLNKDGICCKYFSCGEYGENHTQRPHYHLIIFGWFPDDAVLVPDVKSKSGFETYESKYLDRLWNKGFVSVNNFSQPTAFYVAGYVNKKTGKFDGFLNMSRGIGYQYMIDHFDELNENRLYIGRNGYVSVVPRAFKRVSEKLGFGFKEDPDALIKMRKMENSEVLMRGLDNRGKLRPFVGNKMKDKLNKRLNRL